MYLKFGALGLNLNFEKKKRILQWKKKRNKRGINVFWTFQYAPPPRPSSYVVIQRNARKCKDYGQMTWMKMLFESHNLTFQLTEDTIKKVHQHSSLQNKEEMN